MSCLTPEAALSGDCDFLSANMYARSLFGKSVTICVSQGNYTDIFRPAYRRGCSGKFEHREDGRHGRYYGSCTDQEQDARHRIVTRGQNHFG